MLTLDPVTFWRNSCIRLLELTDLKGDFVIHPFCTIFNSAVVGHIAAKVGEVPYNVGKYAFASRKVFELKRIKNPKISLYLSS